MKSDRKQTILFIIILLLLSMGIGYAFLTTTLSIDGVSDIDSAMWNIHFENVHEEDWSNIPSDRIITPPTISSDGLTINYALNMKEPEELYDFSVDAVNSGTLNAYIDDISLDVKINGVESEFPSYFQHYLYLDEDNFKKELYVGKVLRAGERDKYSINLWYIPEAHELPSESYTLSITYHISFSQFPNSYNYSNKYIYTSDDNSSFLIGNALPNDSDCFEDYVIPKNTFTEFTFLRHYMENNTITSSYVGFEIDNNIYYVKGGDGGISYNSNKAILIDAFGIENCEEMTLDDGYECKIYYPNNLFKWVFIYKNGEVSASNRQRSSCYIYSDGHSECRASFA